VRSTKTGAWRLRGPWKNRVQDLSDRKDETQSTMNESVCLAKRAALRVEVLTLSKPALMSRKREETLSLILWRVLTLWAREGQVSRVLSARREPHWFVWSRPFGVSDSGEHTCHNSFEDLLNCFQEDYYAEG